VRRESQIYRERQWLEPPEQASYDVAFDAPEYEPWEEPYGEPGPAGGCVDCGGGGPGDASCPDCGGPCDPGAEGLFGICSGWPWWQDLGVFFGPQAFKGPPDQGRNGNFGLHYGLNLGGPLAPSHGIGYQVGFQFVNSNFDGDSVVSTTTDSRDQSFVTAGIFRRAKPDADQYFGWQWGLVGDWLRDDFYADVQLAQIRFETGLVGRSGDEIGFWTAFGNDSDTAVFQNQQVDLQSQISQYAFYYRRRFAGGNEGRLWVGFTDGSDTLFGGDVRFALSNVTAIEALFNYLNPNEGSGQSGQNQEAWGLGVNVVFYLGGTAQRSSNSPYRPLFGVADNATFLVNR